MDKAVSMANVCVSIWKESSALLRRLDRYVRMLSTFQVVEYLGAGG